MQKLKTMLHRHDKPGHHTTSTHGDATVHRDNTYDSGFSNSGYTTNTAAPLGTNSGFGSTHSTSYEPLSGHGATHTSNLPVEGVEVAAPRSASAEMTAEIIERQENPAIVRKHVVPIEREEVQTVIEREREIAEIRPIIRPVHERVQAPTREVAMELPEERREYRATMAESEAAKLAGFQREYVAGAATTEIAPTLHEGTTVRDAIVHEVIRPHIIEQVQPIIETEVVQPTVIHTRKPIYEHIVEAPVVLPPRVETAISRHEWESRSMHPVASAASTGHGFAHQGTTLGQSSYQYQGMNPSVSGIPPASTSSFGTSPAVGSGGYGNPSLAGTDAAGSGGYGSTFAGNRAAAARDNAISDAALARNVSTSDAGLARDRAELDAERGVGQSYGRSGVNTSNIL